MDVQQHNMLSSSAFELVLAHSRRWDRAPLRLTCKALRDLVDGNTKRLSFMRLASAWTALPHADLAQRFASVVRLDVGGCMGSGSVLECAACSGFVAQAFEAKWPNVRTLSLSGLDAGHAALIAASCINTRTLIVVSTSFMQSHRIAWQMTYACVRRLRNLSNIGDASQHINCVVNTAVLEALVHCTALTQLCMRLEEGQHGPDSAHLLALWRLTGLRSLVLNCNRDQLQDSSLAGLSALQGLTRFSLEAWGDWPSARADFGADELGMCSLGHCSSLMELRVPALPSQRLHLPRLAKLSVDVMTLASLSALGAMPQLLDLEVTDMWLQGLVPEASACALTSLTVYSSFSVVKSIHLAHMLPHLQTFACSGGCDVEVFSVADAFGGMLALRRLVLLTGATSFPFADFSVSDYAALARLTCLTELHGGCSSAAHAHGISQLSSLTALRIMHFQLDNIANDVVEHELCLCACLEGLGRALQSLPQPLSSLHLDISQLLEPQHAISNTIDEAMARFAQARILKLQLDFAVFHHSYITSSRLHILLAGCTELRHLDLLGYVHVEMAESSVHADLVDVAARLRRLYVQRGLTIEDVYHQY